MINTPVLVIIFNRPDFAKKMYDTLNKLKPSRLYVISDGPRSEEEAKYVKQSREIFSTISWECQVKYDYADTNLGLRRRISGGISWVFQHEEEVIILEDDCIPHRDFFPFCELMLDKYRNDERVMTINGCNLNPALCKPKNESYLFTKYANSWGWATWKRAWSLYDGELKGFENPVVLRNFAFNLPSRKRSELYWNYKIGEVKRKRIDSWAYRWMFTLWSNNGLAIVPKTNLIRNIGNDGRSSNTKGKLHYINIETSALNTEHIVHPTTVLACADYDQWIEDSIYSKSTKHRLIWALKKVTRQI